MHNRNDDIRDSGRALSNAQLDALLKRISEDVTGDIPTRFLLHAIVDLMARSTADLDAIAYYLSRIAGR